MWTNDSCQEGINRVDISIPGIVSVACLYLMILLVGILLARTKKGQWLTQDTTDHIVAGRDVGLISGILTVTATSVGGGYINGTGENIYTPGLGLLWTLAPVFYPVSIMVSGLLFAKKVRERQYFTLVDVFEEKYGLSISAVAYVMIFGSELFWTTSILKALGSTLSVIIGINQVWSIVTSSCIAVIYTLLGGLRSVIFTDIIQLFLVIAGLSLCIPFAMSHPAVSPISGTFLGPDGWLGTLKVDYHLGLYIDSILMLTFGGSVWCCLFQRVLSQKSAFKAQVMCYIASFTTLLNIIPPVLIGAIAKSTDWNATNYREVGCVPIPESSYTLIVPFVIQYLTPLPVAVFGLGAIISAVMSSADSAILSSASIFAMNIYKPLRRKCKHGIHDEVKETEVLWSLRVSILIIGALATVMAIMIQSIYGMFFLAGDFGYFFVFPQFLVALYVPDANTYGALAGTVVCIFLRLTAGEPLLGLMPVFKYPWYDEVSGTQFFPYKTLSLCITLSVILGFSALAKFLFKGRFIADKFDVCKCFTQPIIDETSKENQEYCLNLLKATGTTDATC